MLYNFIEATQIRLFSADTSVILCDEDIYFDRHENEKPELNQNNEDND